MLERLFLKDNPDAVPGVEYNVGDKKYSIPTSLKDSFIPQKYPNAVLRWPTSNETY